MTTPANVPPHASASLYAGNLHPDVNEVNLLEVFSAVGPVASIRVCRDNTNTRRSLGYAYVNFHNISHAESALDILNYTPVKGKPCRIMWSQRDPSIRKTGLGNIFIKNLHKDIDNKSLHDTFSAFGNILSCKVVNDESGSSRGYGYVHYETTEASEQAIAKVNGMHLKDKKVYVGRHVPRRERESKAEEMKKNFRNCFVKNLDEQVTDEEITQLFSQFGQITSIVIMRGEDGSSRGFGFVNYEEHDAAARAVESLNETELRSKKLFVGRAQKKGERVEQLQLEFEARKLERHNKYQGVNLYVKNLDDTVDDAKLQKEFGQFGKITSGKIAIDEKGASKGFGFVCYDTPEEATKAVTEMNGRMVGSKPIYVAPAERKDVRKQKLENQYLQRQQLRMAQQPGAVPNAYMGPPPMFYANPLPPNQRGNGAFMYGMMPQRPGRNWGPGQQGARPFPPNVSNYPENSNYLGGQARGGRQPRNNTRQPNAGQNMPAHKGAVQTGPAAAGGNQPRNRSSQFKYNSGVRNRVDTPPSAPAGTPAPAAPTTGQEPITAAALAALAPDQQKQTLGERIFMMVRQHEPDLAAKITGMLLEMDNSELLHLLESPAGLSSKVDEAMCVLRAHNAVEPEEE